MGKEAHEAGIQVTSKTQGCAEWSRGWFRHCVLAAGGVGGGMEELVEERDEAGKLGKGCFSAVFEDSGPVVGKIRSS